MLMEEEENGRDTEDFQATLYTKKNQTGNAERTYVQHAATGRKGPDNKSGQTELRWNELEEREASRRRNLGRKGILLLLEGLPYMPYYDTVAKG